MPDGQCPARVNGTLIWINVSGGLMEVRCGHGAVLPADGRNYVALRPGTDWRRAACWPVPGRCRRQHYALRANVRRICAWPGRRRHGANARDAVVRMAAHHRRRFAALSPGPDHHLCQSGCSGRFECGTVAVVRHNLCSLAAAGSHTVPAARGAPPSRTGTRSRRLDTFRYLGGAACTRRLSTGDRSRLPPLRLSIRRTRDRRGERQSAYRSRSHACVRRRHRARIGRRRHRRSGCRTSLAARRRRRRTCGNAVERRTAHRAGAPRICIQSVMEGDMFKDWRDTATQLSSEIRTLRSGAPEVMKGFSALAQAALKSDALDTKTKELIALAIAVATRCDGCIAFHAEAAMKHGATRAEVLETMGMAVYMGAGPSVMYAAQALEAFDQFSNKAAAQAA